MHVIPYKIHSTSDNNTFLSNQLAKKIAIFKSEIKKRINWCHGMRGIKTIPQHYDTYIK